MANKIHVTIETDDPASAEPVEIEAVDMAMALTVAEINAERGRAEIWNGGQRLARLRKRGAGEAAYWEVG